MDLITELSREMELAPNERPARYKGMEIVLLVNDNIHPHVGLEARIYR
jgi:hypothetical protein